MSGRLDGALRAGLLSGLLAKADGGAARRAVLERLDGVPYDPLPTTLYIDAQLALVDDMLHYFDRARGDAAVNHWFQAQAGAAIQDYLVRPVPLYGEFMDPDGVKMLLRRHASTQTKRDGELLLSILNARDLAT